jgi:hypothetical protein
LILVRVHAASSPLAAIQIGDNMRSLTAGRRLLARAQAADTATPAHSRRPGR